FCYWAYSSKTMLSHYKSKVLKNDESQSFICLNMMNQRKMCIFGRQLFQLLQLLFKRIQFHKLMSSLSKMHIHSYLLVNVKVCYQSNSDKLLMHFKVKSLHLEKMLTNFIISNHGK